MITYGEIALERAYLVIPCASTVGVRTLVARIDVNQDTAVAVVVGGTFAVSTASKASEGDCLTSKTTMEVVGGGRSARSTVSLDSKGEDCHGECGDEGSENHV